MVIEATNLQFLICYASQKGTAQSIAEDLSEQFENQNLNSSHHLSCISDISVEKLEEFSCVVFIGSTTGDGDPPETARKFMRQLKETVTKTSLNWLHYTILGLGDTNYTNFCNFGKSLDKTLQTGKALRFYNCDWADDGTGLEVVVEPWIEGLFPALKDFLNSPQAKKKPFKRTQNIDCEIEIISKLMMEDSKAPLDAETEPVSLKYLESIFPSLNLPKEEEVLNDSVKNLKFSLEDNLTLPSIPVSYLTTEFVNESYEICHENIIKEGSIPYPFISSDIMHCCISSFRRLTREDAVKQAIEITLRSVEDEKFSFEPGDSFGIIVQNREIEVNLLLHLLKMTEKADLHLNLKVDPNSSKKAASIPKYVPIDCTLRYLFTYCLDIRTIPKKPFLRALVECTSNSLEKRRLTELVSREGTDDYNNFIRLQRLTFIDLLILFPSCTPPVSLLIEHLSRLLPRPFSIISSPLLSPNVISFVFNIIEIPKGGSIMFSREGVCTGWLNSLIKCQESENKEDLNAQMDKLSLTNELQKQEIFIYFRSNQNFRLPKNIETPLIMIGPGTGVAPFLGFITHREIQIKKHKKESSPVMYLFFGCRHKDRDFLFHEELQAFTESGLLSKLCLSFSRDEKRAERDPVYVQDNLVLLGKEIVELIDKKNASVYVCGDAKNMSKNVLDTFLKILKEHLNFSEIEARKYIAQMQLGNRYLQDVWS